MFSVTKLSNQSEARKTILIIKNNLSNKARFNLNNINYSMNAIKTHRSTQRRYWALGLSPSPRATIPRKDQNWFKDGFIFIDQKIIIYHKTIFKKNSKMI